MSNSSPVSHERTSGSAPNLSMPQVTAYNDITALQLDTIYAQNEVLMKRFLSLQKQLEGVERLNAQKSAIIEQLRTDHVNTKIQIERGLLRLEHKISLLHDDVHSTF